MKQIYFDFMKENNTEVDIEFTFEAEEQLIEQMAALLIQVTKSGGIENDDHTDK